MMASSKKMFLEGRLHGFNEHLHFPFFQWKDFTKRLYGVHLRLASGDIISCEPGHCPGPS